MKYVLQPWLAAIFCGFISFTALFASSGEPGGWWRPAFFGFLPMCFFFVGGAIWGMQREIRELRVRVIALNNPPRTK